MIANTVARPAAFEPPEDQLPFLRGLLTLLDNPLEGWPRAIYEAPVYVPPRRDFPTVYVCEPNAIRTILVDRVEDFPKAPVWLRLLKPILGEGILTAEGAQWRWQRQAAAPAFQPRQILDRTQPIVEATERALQRWRETGEGASRDMSAEMVRITSEVILDMFFDGRDQHDIGRLVENFTRYLAAFGKLGVADLIGAPGWARRLMAPQAMSAVRDLRRAIEATIRRRRAAAPAADFFGDLMNAQDPETARRMSDRVLRDNLLTYLAAGHESTSLTLTWAIHLLSHYPDAQARIREEVRRCAKDGPITPETAPALQFTKQVIQETLRLYPSFPAISRMCRRPCTLAGRDFSPGEIVIIPIYALHRHALYWRDPDAFLPERFEPGAGVEARRYIYMPFGGGPRVCIGMAFAMMEATIVLATLLRSAAFEPAGSAPVRPLMRITLRPKGGLPTRVRLVD